MNTLNQAIINTIARPKDNKKQRELKAWEWINAHIKLQNIEKPIKEEIIELYCKLANNYCLEPWEVGYSNKIFKLYNITKEDFVGLLPESPYAAIVIGIKNWKPKFKYSIGQYRDTMEREHIKLTLLESINNISNNIFKKNIIRLIEKEYFESWEHLKNVMDFYNLYMEIDKRYKGLH